MVRYLEDYEHFLDVPIYRNVRVKRIDPGRHGWRLTTSDGIWQARNVIIATGNERVPFIASWPGHNEFTGELVHAAHFGRADHFQDKCVLVVGAGNSESDVLNHLVRIITNALWVSVRNGPTILPTRVLGMPMQLMSPLFVLLVSHLGVLDNTGHPTHPGPIPHPDRKGLWFTGFSPRLPGVFYSARAEAKQLTRQVQRLLDRRHTAFTRQAFSRAMM